MSRSQIFIVALIGVALSIYSIFTLDQNIAPLVLALDESSIETWTFITDLGNSKYMAILLTIIWIDALVFGKLRPNNPIWPIIRKKAALVFASVFVTGMVVLVVKFIAGRPRPYMGDVNFYPFIFGSDFASWPSGHTTTAFAFAAAVGMAVPILRWPLMILAGVIGYSRMVLGVHYLADIIMGATLGTLGAIMVYNWLRPKLGLKA